jgi:predicted RNA-binding Zn-ribbon protein involved in translation (DUF1610 family)
MVSRYLKKCPACARLINPSEVPAWEATGFDCPGCGARLRNSDTVIKLLAVIAVVVSLGVFRFVEYRGVARIAVAVFAFLLILFVLGVVIVLIYPQRLVLYRKPGARNPPTFKDTDSGSAE